MFKEMLLMMMLQYIYVAALVLSCTCYIVKYYYAFTNTLFTIYMGSYILEKGVPKKTLIFRFVRLQLRLHL